MKNKVTTTLAAATIMAVGWLIYDKVRNVPEHLSGFPELSQGYCIRSVDIETRGDVIHVEYNPNARRINNIDGSVTYEGDFSYSIRPDIAFAPNDELNTDAEGNTPHGPHGSGAYWSDIRPGKIVLEPCKNNKEYKGSK